MTEQMPENKVNEIFKEIFSNEFPLTVEDGLEADVATLYDFFRHFQQLGYSDDEITTIFDLVIEGDMYEV